MKTNEFKVNQIVALSAQDVINIHADWSCAMYSHIVEYASSNPETFLQFEVVDLSADGRPKLLPVGSEEYLSGLFLFEDWHCDLCTPVLPVEYNEDVESTEQVKVKPRVRISASGRRQFSYEFKLMAVHEYKALPVSGSYRKGTMELLSKLGICLGTLKYWCNQQENPEGFSYPVAWSRRPDSIIKGVN